VTEGGVAGSEVVEPDADPEPLEAEQVIGDHARSLEQDRLGDLQSDGPWIGTGSRQRHRDRLRERSLEELPQ
jgi:hypothetical protein